MARMATFEFKTVDNLIVHSTWVCREHICRKNPAWSLNIACLCPKNQSSMGFAARRDLVRLQNQVVHAFERESGSYGSIGFISVKIFRNHPKDGRKYNIFANKGLQNIICVLEPVRNFFWG